MNNVLAGMQIIARYDEDFEICAEHDTIYAGAGIKTLPMAMTEEDRNAMEKFGWEWDGESWRAFT